MEGKKEGDRVTTFDYNLCTRSGKKGEGGEGGGGKERRSGAFRRSHGLQDRQGRGGSRSVDRFRK